RYMIMSSECILRNFTTKRELMETIHPDNLIHYQTIEEIKKTIEEQAKKIAEMERRNKRE
ncbi:MAG: hypothetical protein LBF89_09370, partial [Bacteroidales bacterium]|nr:hypothetical protein [Bacteroidales bacterium]